MRNIISAKPAPSFDVDDDNVHSDKVVGIVTFIVPAILVSGLLFLLIRFRGELEAAVANLSLLLPVGYAFAAGMVASVNPCGVLMLPAYFLYQLKDEETGSSVVRRVLKGLLIAAAVTVGFVVIFAITGGIIAAGGRWLSAVFPYAGLLIGVAMVGLGLWLLATGKTLGIVAAKEVTVERQRTLGNAFLFGVTYAVGSLSCTLPIFLVVVGSSLASEGWLFSFGQFVGYALGMGTIIVVVSIGAALFRRAVFKWLRLLRPYIHRLNATFLIGAGAYLVYYWVFQAGLSF
ncbi:MAG: cytochrome c biogenesis protein CcdA [Chloroflexi bacterium]|nr:cytochrome c biogenesis protein CcdA [Chloroflexota bacterium]